MPAALSLNAPKDCMHAARANTRRSPHDRNRSHICRGPRNELTRIALATLASTVIYFILGGILFAASALKREFERFPEVYRSAESMKGVWPAGIAGMILSMLALSILFAMLPQEGSALARGLHFGLLVGVFALGSFVLHNYVNLNIDLRLTLGQAAAYFLQWIVVGVVIASVYKLA